MITPKELRTIKSQLIPILREITENYCFSDYQFLDSPPNAPCQFWEYDLDFLNEYSVEHPCGYFTGTGKLLNPELSINQFFQNNDKIMEEFDLLTEQGVFDPLLPHLHKAKELSGLELGVMLSIQASISGGDEWLQDLCEETVLILHEHEETNNKMDIGCQQSERYNIKINDGQRITFLHVPFDKVSLFKDAVRVEGYYNEPYFPYQVALSFAGEDRYFVSKVARELKKRNIRVFYDDYEKVSLWGKDLYTHLDDVYRNKARYCLLFISKSYKDKVWTNHERESAQARAFKEKQEYILPVRLDDTEIPGIRQTVGYIDGQSIQPKALSDLVYKKLRQAD